MVGRAARWALCAVRRGRGPCLCEQVLLLVRRLHRVRLWVHSGSWGHGPFAEWNTRLLDGTSHTH